MSGTVMLSTACARYSSSRRERCVHTDRSVFWNCNTHTHAQRDRERERERLIEIENHTDTQTHTPGRTFPGGSPVPPRPPGWAWGTAALLKELLWAGWPWWAKGWGPSLTPTPSGSPARPRRSASERERERWGGGGGCQGGWLTMACSSLLDTICQTIKPHTNTAFRLSLSLSVCVCVCVWWWPTHGPCHTARRRPRCGSSCRAGRDARNDG